MQIANLPTKFPNYWAWNATDPTYVRDIPTTSQIGIDDGFASLPDGFPPLTFVPEASGGVPPYGQDANGIFRQVTQWCRWLTANPIQPYDGTWQTAIGGYNRGAVVSSATNFGHYWLSTADNNVTDPDASGAGWLPWSPGGVNNYVVDTGAANALVVTPGPALGSYSDGVSYIVDPAHANTGATTINVSGLGARAIVHVDGTALANGEIQAGRLMQITALGSNFVWINAPYVLTRSPNDNSNFPASTAYVDAMGAALDNYAGSIVGLITSNTPSFTTTRITVAVGNCRDSTNTSNMALVAPLNKSLTSTWAAGTNNGGRESSWASLAAAQSGFVFLIYNPTTTATDVLFSQSPSAPTLPSGYTIFRRIGSFILEAASTSIHQFIQIGSYFEYFLRSADFASTANGGGVPHYRVVSVPLGIKVKATFYFQSTGTVGVYLSGIYDPDLGAPPAFGGPTQWAQIRRTGFLDQTSTPATYGTVVTTQYTDTAACVYTFTSDTADFLALGVTGYEDIGLYRFF